MNRDIAIERIFSLGDYQNLKVTDSITSIPEDVGNNPQAMALLRYLQLVDVELTYLSYMKVKLNIPKLTGPEIVDEALVNLEFERQKTFEQLLATIKPQEDNK